MDLEEMRMWMPLPQSPQNYCLLWLKLVSWHLLSSNLSSSTNKIKSKELRNNYSLKRKKKDDCRKVKELSNYEGELTY
jgi:hypothetical protein